MRKVFLGLMVSTLVLLSSAAYGAVAINDNGTYKGECVTIDMPSTWVTAFDGSTATIDPTAVIRFYPHDFVSVSGGGTTTIPLTTVTTPSLETENSALCMNWGETETSYAQVTFRVPSDYVDSGGFRVLCDQDGDPDYGSGESHCEISFAMRIHTVDAETAWATVDYPVDVYGSRVALAGVQHGSPEVVTLPIGETLAAGNLVTLNIWRTNDTSSEGTNANAAAHLEVYYVEFYYSAN